MEKIYSVKSENYEEILDLWEDSVRATHDFVGEEEIKKYRPLIKKYMFPKCEVLYIKRDDEIAGFIGFTKENIDMLFVKPKYFRQGIGKILLNHVIENYKLYNIDVNEENPEALKFYEKMGFKIIKRSSLDSQGDPHPILHLEFKK